MALDQTSNFVRQGVASSVGSADTTISVSDASEFPNPANGEYNCVLWDTSAGRPDQDSNAEIVRVTGRDTTNDDLTVTRGQEGTSAVSHPSSSALQLAPTAKMFSDIDSQKLGDGENFDGQGTSDFTNVNSVETGITSTTGVSGGTTTTLLDALNSNSEGLEIRSQPSVSVGTSATAIIQHTQGLQGLLVVVAGHDGSGNRFTDILTMTVVATPIVQHSDEGSGGSSPASRSYSRSGDQIDLAMGSDSYTVAVAMLLLNQ